MPNAILTRHQYYVINCIPWVVQWHINHCCSGLKEYVLMVRSLIGNDGERQHAPQISQLGLLPYYRIQLFWFVVICFDDWDVGQQYNVMLMRLLMDNNKKEITHLPAGRGKEITSWTPRRQAAACVSACSWMKCGTRIQEDQSLHGLPNDVWMFIRECDSWIEWLMDKLTCTAAHSVGCYWRGYVDSGVWPLT